MISNVFRPKARGRVNFANQGRETLRAKLELPVPIHALKIYSSPKWIVEDKGWLCAIREARSASTKQLINSSWPYSRIVDGPYQYFTAIDNQPFHTSDAAVFVEPINFIEFDLIRWNDPVGSAPTPSRVAWLGKATDGTKVAGWVNVE